MLSYHCAPGGSMAPWHVVRGMNGAIMVLPRDGLKDKNEQQIKYTKAFYIVSKTTVNLLADEKRGMGGLTFKLLCILAGRQSSVFFK